MFSDELKTGGKEEGCTRSNGGSADETAQMYQGGSGVTGSDTCWSMEIMVNCCLSGP